MRVILANMALKRCVVVFGVIDNSEAQQKKHKIKVIKLDLKIQKKLSHEQRTLVDQVCTGGVDPQPHSPTAIGWLTSGQNCGYEYCIIAGTPLIHPRMVLATDERTTTQIKSEGRNRNLTLITR